jgi:hypothetical protein
MRTHTINEQIILEELQRVPAQQWDEVLALIRSLQSGEQVPAGERPIHSGADLAGSDLIGIWADRADIGTVASSPGTCGVRPSIA